MRASGLQAAVDGLLRNRGEDLLEEGVGPSTAHAEHCVQDAHRVGENWKHEDRQLVNVVYMIYVIPT